MKKSAGVALLFQDRILMAHPSKGGWYRSWTPPKGGIEEGESEKSAAVREVKEECGIEVNESQLGERHVIRYTRGNKVYKEVYLYVVEIGKLQEAGMPALINYTLPKHMLQLEEVDSAKFMTKDECMERALPRYIDFIDKIL
jgi:ADP-ribose pyrophosphatase YjhB (NUDIX family)